VLFVPKILGVSSSREFTSENPPGTGSVPDEDGKALEGEEGMAPMGRVERARADPDAGGQEPEVAPEAAAQRLDRAEEEVAEADPDAGGAAAEDAPLAKEDDVHIIFSTGCNPYQHWQSEVMFWNWRQMQHRGRITRIASGCNTDHQKEQVRKTSVVDERIGVFIVEEQENKQHKWLNKPVAMKNFFQSDPKEKIYILLDPDMIIVKPFDQYMDVTEGDPIAQKYGIGGKWLQWNLCNSTMCKIDDRKAWDWYSVGPPIIMHKNDWIKVANSWYNYAPEVYKHDSSILSDMYSYAIGAADNNIKHRTVTNMMVSDANSNYFEGWDKINVKNYDKYGPLEVNVLHFCQTYFLGKNYRDSSLAWGTFNWHKGHLPHDVMVNCEYNLLVEVETTPENLAKDKGNGRHLWMLHHLITRVNAGIKSFKEAFCEGWQIKHDIVLIQPESDKRNRMWYILGHFDDSGKRNNLSNTNGRRRRRLLAGLRTGSSRDSAVEVLLDDGLWEIEYWDSWDSPT